MKIIKNIFTTFPISCRYSAVLLSAAAWGPIPLKWLRHHVATTLLNSLIFGIILLPAIVTGGWQLIRLYKNRINSRLKSGVNLKIILSSLIVCVIFKIHFDQAKLLHMIIYQGLGFFIYREILLFNRDRNPDDGRGPILLILMSIFLGTMVGGVDEFLQWCIPYRIGSFEDVFTDFKAVALGTGLSAIVHTYPELLQQD